MHQKEKLGKLTQRADNLDNKVIVVLNGTGTNDAIRGLMHDYGNALAESGYTIVHASFEVAELQYVVNLMRDQKVYFVLTWLGIGQDLSGTSSTSNSGNNVFEFYQVPLVKVQGDLPAYFIDFHRDVPRNAINLYQAEEFVDFRRTWLPEARAMSSLLPPMPMVPMQRGEIDLRSRREGTLFFVKNGNSVQALFDTWDNTLPHAVALMARQMAHDLVSHHLRTGRIDLGDWVANYLEGEGVLPQVTPKLVWFYAAQMDDLLRRAKSTLVAEALLDLPIVVQGNFWEHVNFEGRRARHVKGSDVFASQEILLKQLGVIDMSANVDTWPHDRVQRGAGSYSLVLTNRQEWLTDRFPEFSDLTYQFDADSVAERVADVLNHRDRYLEMSISFGERFRTVYPRNALADVVIPLVEQTRWLWMEPKPQLQDFFVWTKNDGRI